jgi:hypothetical protein
MCFRNCGHLGMPSGRPVVVAERVSGRLRNWTPQRPLSAAAFGTAAGVRRVGVRRVNVRTVGRCPDGWCPRRTLPQPVDVRPYRNRSPSWRPLDGCRHCR